MLAFVLATPTMAAADPVNDLLNNVGLGNVLGGSPSPGSDGATEPKATDTDPPYTPPLHGTNPHGQGTAATIQVFPSGDFPVDADPVENGESIVLGGSRGEQDAGTGAYHGSVTLAHILGFPIVQVQSNPGDPPQNGPLQPLQDALDQLCSDSGDLACLTVGGMHSSTTSNSSTNSFQGAEAEIGGPFEDLVGFELGAEALSSEGNISQDGSCQTSHGSSLVTGLSAGRLGLGLFNSSSDSTACNNGTSSVNQNSSAILLNDEELVPDCSDGTPDTVLDAAPLALLFCNVNDENAGQTSTPYGVREALTALLLPFPEDEELPFLALLKGTAASAESHAVVPPVTTTPTPPGTPPGGGTQGGTGGGGGGAGGGNAGGGGGDGAVAGQATAGTGELAFTGSDLLWLALVGDLLILGGLVLTTGARRHDRETA